jgi:hypothetical protein
VACELSTIACRVRLSLSALHLLHPRRPPLSLPESFTTASRLASPPALGATQRSVIPSQRLSKIAAAEGQPPPQPSRAVSVVIVRCGKLGTVPCYAAALPTNALNALPTLLVPRARPPLLCHTSMRPALPTLRTTHYPQAPDMVAPSA